MWTKSKSAGEFERWSAKYDEFLFYLQDNEFILDYYRSEWLFKHILSNAFTSFFFSIDRLCCIREEGDLVDIQIWRRWREREGNRFGKVMRRWRFDVMVHILLIWGVIWTKVDTKCKVILYLGTNPLLQSDLIFRNGGSI